MNGWIGVATIETMLWREHLAEPELRPSLKDSVWVENIPVGPMNPEGLRRLREIQEHYGFGHVTTGNASPGTRGLFCGVYVRESAYEDAPNPLRAYLSEGR